MWHYLESLKVNIIYSPEIPLLCIGHRDILPNTKARATHGDLNLNLKKSN